MKEVLFTSMPMFVCLFWFVMLVLDIIQNSRANYRICLCVFFLTTTILYFGHCVFFNHSISLIPITDWLYTTSNLAVYPLYFLYVSMLTQEKTPLAERIVLMVPTIACFVAEGLLYCFSSPSETELFIHDYLYENEFAKLTGLALMQAHVHAACKVVFAAQIIPVLYFGYRAIESFNNRVNNIYSNVEEKRVPVQIHWLLVFFVVTSIFSFIANILGRQVFDDSIWFLAIPSVIFSALLFSLGFLGFSQRFSIQDVLQEERLSSKDDVIDEISPSLLRTRIEQVMEDQQIYLQPNLKLMDLVREVQSNRNYVYNVINKEMGMSFSEYVNRWRVTYAKTLIAQKPNMPLSQVSTMSGFTSSASFYRNFKIYSGVSPKEYKGSSAMP